MQFIKLHSNSDIYIYIYIYIYILDIYIYIYIYTYIYIYIYSFRQDLYDYHLFLYRRKLRKHFSGMTQSLRICLKKQQTFTKTIMITQLKVAS